MRIRKFREEDVERLVEIWFKGSIKAHYFISPEYWSSKKLDMKDTYLPQSDTYVIEGDEMILGFGSMVDHYLAALFVDTDHQKKGYGKRLVEFVKHNHQHIELKVYQQNHQAVNFYLLNEWVIKEETLDAETSEKEYVMVWKK